MTLTDLGALAKEITGSDEVFIDVRINDYGRHITVWDGQWNHGETWEGDPLTGPDGANVVACASAATTDLAIDLVSELLAAQKAGAGSAAVTR